MIFNRCTCIGNGNTPGNFWRSRYSVLFLSCFKLYFPQFERLSLKLEVHVFNKQRKKHKTKDDIQSVVKDMIGPNWTGVDTTRCRGYWKEIGFGILKFLPNIAEVGSFCVQTLIYFWQGRKLRFLWVFRYHQVSGHLFGPS